MDLRHEERKAAAPCFVCGHAGKDAVIWPQEPLRVPQDIGQGSIDLGAWKVYVTSYSDEVRSGRKTIEICVEHYNSLGANWIEIAQSEVDLENAWHSYLDRMER